MSESTRCPACGALVSPDAEWCGQCFRPLESPDPEPATAADPRSELAPSRATGEATGTALAGASAKGSASVSEGTGATVMPTWPCPACDNANPIELDVCAVCGTSFASLMRQDEATPQVDPKDALAWSLIYPGLGHRKVGRGLDGLARGVLFTMLFAMSMVVVISGVSSAGLLGVFLLFMTMALTVYFGSAYEAYRLAEGGSPLVSARALLWATVGVIMTSVVLLALTVVTAARR